MVVPLIHCCVQRARRNERSALSREKYEGDVLACITRVPPPVAEMVTPNRISSEDHSPGRRTTVVN